MGIKEKYQEVAEKLLSAIEAGTPPWRRGWKASGASWPTNAASGRKYSGGNAMYLMFVADELGWSDLRFLTFTQALAMKGCVRKGEKGQPIFFWSKRVKLPAALEGKVWWQAGHPKLRKAYPNRLPEGTMEALVQNCSTVFNVSQVDFGEPSPESVLATAPVVAVENYADAARLLDRCRQAVPVTFGSFECPAYLPSGDRVQCPERGNFENDAGFYSALFHEFSHASGARHRLDREGFRGQRSKAKYAFEELVAESSAAFVCAQVGIPYQEQHAAYLSTWVKHLRDEYEAPAEALMKAFSQSSRAADCVLGGLPSAAWDKAA